MRRFVLLLSSAVFVLLVVACQDNRDGACGGGCVSPHGVAGHGGGTSTTPAADDVAGDFLVDGLGKGSTGDDRNIIMIRTAAPEGCRGRADAGADAAVDGDTGTGDGGVNADAGADEDGSDGQTDASNADGAVVPAVLIEDVEVVLLLPATRPRDGSALDLEQLGAYATLLQPGTCAKTRVALAGKVEGFSADDPATSRRSAYRYRIQASSAPGASRTIHIDGSVSYVGASTSSYPATSDSIDCY